MVYSDDEYMQSDVVNRFMRYVKINSPSRDLIEDPLEKGEEIQTPSHPFERRMASYLADELSDIGLRDVKCNKNAYVTAHIPASKGYENKSAIGLIAHLDVASDVPNVNVKPQIKHYRGGEFQINDRIKISPNDLPELNKHVGEAFITSDGNTLLGSDDKAGVAEIVSLAARLMEYRNIIHPRIGIAFVPDEEIGHGAELLDIDDFDCKWAYTIDGETIGTINYECFNADEAHVSFHGRVVHPGAANGIMINATTLMRDFDSMLPLDERAENTKGYEGYVHCLSMDGTPEDARSIYLIRDFDNEGFGKHHDDFLNAAKAINEKYDQERVKVDFLEEYRNMADKLHGLEFLIDYAKEANEEVGLTPIVRPIRGGTDGAQLTFRGLPCPNLATGGLLCHSVRECIPVSSLEKSVDMLQHLVTKFV